MSASLLDTSGSLEASSASSRSAPRPALRIQLIETLAEFAQLQEGWSRLACMAHAPPFQTYQWCHAWVRSIGAAQGYLPRVAAAWWDTHLVGILPLVHRSYRGIRLLEWIGARVSDYCDALVHPAYDRALLLRTMWGKITERNDYDSCDWDRCRMTL
ncbi:MAG: hypothetical protein JOZ93_07445 [Sinobacteraceae bacterium]|nr:hypothetical protein [Nevskiaceae bacterium]